MIKQLTALPESAMRREVLIERLQKMTILDILDFFSHIIIKSACRSTEHLIALDTVHQAVLWGQKEAHLYELFSDVYRVAKSNHNEGVCRLLMMTRPKRGPLEKNQVPADLEMSRLTLGERKFIARGHNRDKLDRLLFDPEPTVIRNLLRNPQLTEETAVRLAARRPTRAEIQEEIYNSRWGDRYRVRVAIVCNPYTPTEISLKLLSFLLKKDLQMVKRDTNLHELIRQEAKDILERKGRS